MADLKGKFVTLACSLLETKPEAKTAALAAVKQMTGKEWNELDPEGWYDTKVMNAVFQAIEDHTSPLLAWAAIKVIGRRVYPTIESSVGLPPNLNTPLDFVKFEAQGFLANHRGSEVVPRKIISAEPGLVVMEAPSPGYKCSFIEGVFEGILIMCDIRNGKVKQTRCVTKGDPTCEYVISW
jgi:predicted hydrocarbon binding protein